MTEKEREILINKRIAKAKARINEVNNHISLGYFDTSLNRIYYSCFYCVQALLIKIDLFPKTHSGIITLFNLHYVKEEKFPRELARFYQDLFSQRLLADYSDEYEPEPEMIKELLTNALEFIEYSDNLLKKNS